MQLTERNLSDKPVSASYQDVVQQYNSYLLDGLGNIIENVNITASCTTTSSFTYINIESSSFASSSLSSSYALSASYALNAGGSSGTTLTTGSFYPITSSWATSASYTDIALDAMSSDYALLSQYAISSSYSETAIASDYTLLSQYAISSSYSEAALSASYTPTPHIEKGIISGSTFSGDPKQYTIYFNQPFFTDIYILSIIGEDARVWSYGSKTTGSVIINSNNSSSFTGMVDYRIEEV